MICINYFNNLKIGNTDKSKIIHFDINNNEASYVLGFCTPCTVDEERDLEVIIDTSSSAVTERPRDALCPSVFSLNKTISCTEWSLLLLLLRLQIYHCVTLSSA